MTVLQVGLEFGGDEAKLTVSVCTEHSAVVLVGHWFYNRLRST